MKKLIYILLTLSLLIPLGACTQKTPPKEDVKKEASAIKYKDGSYTAQGDKWQNGQEEAVVEIKDSKITSIILKRLDTSGKEVDYEKWQGQKDESGKVYPNLKQYRMDMSNKMLEKQSPDVDTISGATTSTKNWKIAVQRALDKAKK